MEQDPMGDNLTEGAPDPANDSYEIPGWHAGLAAAYKGHPALKGMDVPSKLVEAYLSAKDTASQFEGRSYIPGENASSEEWSSYRKAMGVPDTKDGYAFKIPDDMDRNEAEGLAAWIKDVAFEEGLPVQSTQRIFDRWAKDTKLAREDMHLRDVASKQERVTALKEKLGERYDNRVTSANDFAKNRLGEKVYNSLTEKALMDDPDYIEAFGALSDALSEDNLPGGGSSSGGGAERDGISELFPTMK